MRFSTLDRGRHDGRHSDAATEAIALTNLGLALPDMGRSDEAITACQRCWHLRIALNSLGLVLFKVHRFDEAMNAQRDAVAIFREIGDQRRENVALDDLEAVRSGQV